MQLTMTFEMVTFDMAADGAPTAQDIEAYGGARLRRAAADQLVVLSELVGKPVEKVRTKVARAVGLADLAAGDDADLREALRVVLAWIREPTSAPAAAKRRYGPRPQGMGQLPVPRAVKPAAGDIACALCTDAIKAGELAGRMRAPVRPYVAMGWLCRHCFLERRAAPRRRDVLLRMFHQLFSGNAVDLNAHECAVLHTWLLQDPAMRTTDAWRADPLEATLVRLQTATSEEKASTWLAAPTAHTILNILIHAEDEATSALDQAMLTAAVQHLQQWQTPPTGLDRPRFGTGWRYRAELLKRAEPPTVLSVAGGPFDLHTAPPPREDADADDASA